MKLDIPAGVTELFAFDEKAKLRVALNNSLITLYYSFTNQNVNDTDGLIMPKGSNIVMQTDFANNIGVASYPLYLFNPGTATAEIRYEEAR